MGTCERCGTELQPDETHTHHGQTLCEDCYMDALNPPKGCDPWAVYTAKRSMDMGTTLTQLQRRIIEILEKEGPTTPADLSRRLQGGATQIPPDTDDFAGEGNRVSRAVV